jgi:hypothetical protein
MSDGLRTVISAITTVGLLDIALPPLNKSRFGALPQHFSAAGSGNLAKVLLRMRWAIFI